MTTDPRRLRASVFLAVTLIAAFGFVAYGLAALLVPGDLLATSPPAALVRTDVYGLSLIRLLGYFNIILGGLAVVLVLQARRKGTARSLAPPLVVVAAAYAGPIVFDVTSRTVGPAEVAEMLLLTAVLASGAVALAAPNGPGAASRD